jgi:hypothetical protein|tara:strand:+ start:741 stop:914 length:174 start_codon:yes stop_codon:yes gene_type:complete
MKKFRILMLVLFVGTFNLTMISCRETTEDDHGDMEMEQGGMEGDDMEMDHNESMDHD